MSGSKPFAFQVATFSFLAFVLPLFLFLYLLTTARSPRVTVLTSTLACFGVMATLFAFGPFNVYNGMGAGQGRGKRTVKVADLNDQGRRVLYACYLPVNRRRAAYYILATGVLFLGSWAVVSGLEGRSVLKLTRFPSAQLVAIIFVLTIPMGALAGYVGLLRQIGKRWKQVTSEGPRWPRSVEYPGPWRDRISSVITGRMPQFLVEEDTAR